MRKHLQGIDGGATYVGDVSNYGIEDDLSAWAMQQALQDGGFNCVGNLVHEPIPGTLVELSEEQRAIPHLRELLRRGGEDSPLTQFRLGDSLLRTARTPEERAAWGEKMDGLKAARDERVEAAHADKLAREKAEWLRRLDGLLLQRFGACGVDACRLGIRDRLE